MIEDNELNSTKMKMDYGAAAAEPMYMLPICLQVLAFVPARKCLCILVSQSMLFPSQQVYHLSGGLPVMAAILLSILLHPAAEMFWREKEYRL